MTQPSPTLRDQTHDATAHEINTQDVNLAQSAAKGDVAARREINTLAQPMIQYQTEQFCPRFCHDNRYRYQCTLPSKTITPGQDSPLCEWGNASYGWMLHDLTKPDRLNRFQGREGASLSAYFFQIANSLPFYERWKDWRLGRRTHVPTYIQDLGPDAAKVFHGLRKGDNAMLIAQQLGRSEHDVDGLIQLIIIELTQHKRLYLLDKPKELSLSHLGTHNDDDDEGSVQADISCEDLAPEEIDAQEHIRHGWSQLTATEQFVLEAMLIEEREADEVISALKRLNITLSDRVPVQDTDRQQLYYFRRKAVAKLAQLSGLIDED